VLEHCGNYFRLKRLCFAIRNQLMTKYFVFQHPSVVFPPEISKLIFCMHFSIDCYILSKFVFFSKMVHDCFIMLFTAFVNLRSSHHNRGRIQFLILVF